MYRSPVTFCRVLCYDHATIGSNQVEKGKVWIIEAHFNESSVTFRVFRNPDVRWRTVETLGLAALLARCGEGNGVIESLVALPVHSLQLNSDADLLKCLRKDEQRDSKFNLDFSVEKGRKKM